LPWSVASFAFARWLLSPLIKSIESLPLLNVHALEGLAQLLLGASPGYLDADDLVEILMLLSTRLQGTHKQSPRHVYQLTLTIAPVLDAMVNCEVKDVDRVNLHEPLLSYLETLKSNKNPYIVFQASYAYQTLLFVADNESSWHATLRRSGMVLKGLSGLVSAVKGLNVNEFIEGVGHIQGGLEGIGQVYGLAKDAYKEVKTLTESGQSLLEALKTGLSFSQKREWYPLLRGIDLLLRNGQLTKFEALVCGAPCRHDPAFLWVYVRDSVILPRIPSGKRMLDKEPLPSLAISTRMIPSGVRNRRSSSVSWTSFCDSGVSWV
jgi:hypothetical protein